MLANIAVNLVTEAIFGVSVPSTLLWPGGFENELTSLLYRWFFASLVRDVTVGSSYVVLYTLARDMLLYAHDRAKEAVRGAVETVSGVIDKAVDSAVSVILDTITPGDVAAGGLWLFYAMNVEGGVVPLIASMGDGVAPLGVFEYRGGSVTVEPLSASKLFGVIFARDNAYVVLPGFAMFINDTLWAGAYGLAAYGSLVSQLAYLRGHKIDFKLDQYIYYMQHPEEIKKMTSKQREELLRNHPGLKHACNLISRVKKLSKILEPLIDMLGEEHVVEIGKVKSLYEMLEKLSSQPGWEGDVAERLKWIIGRIRMPITILDGLGFEAIPEHIAKGEIHIQPGIHVYKPLAITREDILVG